MRCKIDQLKQTSISNDFTLFSLKPLKTTLFLVTYLYSSFIFAENILNLSDGVNLIAVNGKEAENGGFLNNKSAYALPNGTNQIVINYTAEIKNGSEYELEYSNAFVLLFEQQDKTLFLSAPKINKIKDIKALENSGAWILTDNNGQEINYKVSLIKNSGFQLSRDYERELEDFNKTDAAAALPKPPLFDSKNVMINPATANNNNTSAKENMPAKMLMFWYNQADEKTRNSFKEFIKKH